MTTEPAATPASDLPALAECDVELWTEYLGDFISVWLKNSPQFLQEQKQKMLQMALCPFLFGVTLNVPMAWQEALHICGVLDKNRTHETTSFSDSEMEIVEMAETIFSRCSQLVENRNDLKTILNFIYDVEERPMMQDRIDINYALQNVVSLEVFTSMWAPIKRIYENRKKKAHICIIYYFKIISQHVIFYGRDGVDKSDHLKRILSEVNKEVKNEPFPESNLWESELSEEDLKSIINCCSSNIKKNPFETYWYSDRAQAYQDLSDYRSALCDCKRAIILDPNNYQHYLIAAKSYLELKQLEKAGEANQQCLTLCADPVKREKILQQGQEIQVKIRMTKVRQSDLSSGNEEKDIYNFDEQFKLQLCKGYNYYIANVFGQAVEHFRSAINILSKPDNEGLTIDDDELHVIWFVYGLSCVKTANIRNLQAAIEKFQAIISQSETFPAAYYGLGLAYMAMKRYKEAEEVFRAGLEQINKHPDAKVYHWPHTKTVIEETDISVVQKMMEEMLKECLHPPKADAICKFHTDDSKREIYFTDPDYKGHICIKCRAGCSIEFHPQCWIITDNQSRGKTNWKEMLDAQCPTPGCWGLIFDIFIYRPDLEKPLRLSSQVNQKIKTRPSQPKLKMKTESVLKRERKLEKKKLRKEKRQEAKGSNETMEESGEQTQKSFCQNQLDEEEAARNLTRSGTQLLKDDPETLVLEKKQKVNKLKKKEKKPKQFLTFDLQFKKDEHIERYGINYLDEEEELMQKKPVLPSLVEPVQLPTPGSEPSSTAVTNLDKSILNLFFRVLSAKGPIDLFSLEMDDQIKFLSDTAQTRIHECGGLVSFLSSDPRFNISHNKTLALVQTDKLSVPERIVQGKAWGNKWSEESGLNPSAKEFIPFDNKSSSGSKSVDLAEHSSSNVDSSSSELPPPADDSDDGFTTVVNKKRTHAQNVQSAVYVDTYKPAASLKGHYSHNTVDELKFPSNISKPTSSSYNTVDELKFPSSISKPTSSSYNTVDEIKLPSNIPKEVYDNLMKEKSKIISGLAVSGEVNTSSISKNEQIKNKLNESSIDDAHIPSLPSLFDIQAHPVASIKGHSNQGSEFPWNGPVKMNPIRSSLGDIHTHSIPPLMGHNCHGSDASDVSADDLLRMSSPSLSTNSGSSSSRADSSRASIRSSKTDNSGGASAHVSAHLPPSLRPLKAPAIVMPSRGKKKRPIGQNAPRLTSSLLADRNLIYDGCEDESVSSTTSDKDSTGLKSVVTNTVLTTEADTSISTAGKDTISGACNQNITSRLNVGNKTDDHHHQTKTNELESSKRKFGTALLEDLVYCDEFIPSNLRLGANLHSGKGDESKYFSSENNRSSLSFQKDSFTSDHSSIAALKNVFPSNNLSATFESAQQPLTSRISAHGAENSQRQAAFETKSLRDTTWSSYNYFGTPKSDTSADGDVIRESMMTPSNPCMKSDKLYTPSSDNVFYRKGSLEVGSLISESTNTNSQNSGYIPSIHNQEGVFQSVQLSNDVLGQVKVRQNVLKAKPSNPWFRALADNHENQSLLSATARGISLDTLASSSLSSSLWTPPNNYQPYKLSTNTIDVQPTISLHTNLSNINKSDNSDLSARGASITSGHSEKRVAHLQTIITSQDITDMMTRVKNLEESCASREYTLLENAQLKEALKKSESDISQEKAAKDKLKQDLIKMASKLQTAEKLKSECENQQVNTHLEAENEALTEELKKVNKLLDNERLKCLNAQLDLVELKSSVAKEKLDVKRQEAVQHLHRLANVIAQAGNEGKSLPQSVYKTNSELSTYITSCDTLKHQIEVTSQKMKHELLSGIAIDLSTLAFNSPALPHPPKELTEVPQATSNAVVSSSSAFNKAASSSVSTRQSANKPAQQEEDEDTKAYLSMFYTDSSQSSGSSTSQKDEGITAGHRASTPLVLTDDQRQKNTISMPAQPLASKTSSRLAMSQTRPLSPAVMSGGSLGAASGLPGTRTLQSQPEAQVVTPAPLSQTQIVKPLSSLKYPKPVLHVKPKSYFERIVETVEEHKPGCSRIQIQDIVDKLRHDNGGSLSAWTFEDLATRVLLAILDSEKQEVPKDVNTLDKHLSNSWTKPKNVFQCSICQSDIEHSELLTLSCGHKFHESCIQKWLQSDRTCPNCRSHALLQQDFPSLT